MFELDDHFLLCSAEWGRIGLGGGITSAKWLLEIASVVMIDAA